MAGPLFSESFLLASERVVSGTYRFVLRVLLDLYNDWDGNLMIKG